MTELRLNHGLVFEDLYRRDGLVRIDALFRDHLRGGDEGLADRLAAARAGGLAGAAEESDLILALAPHLEDFLGSLFSIEAELQELAQKA
ncbi:MAG: hypothetical protein WCF16_11640, partial [Alphaproteobacteria bacterium]